MVSTQTKNTVICLTTNIVVIGSIIKSVLAVRKAKTVIKRTMIKFIGLDLLKMLVIINCFCIFAS